MTEHTHSSVLLESSIASLELSPSDIVVDGTFGGGGHSAAIYEHIYEKGLLICVDLDEAAQERFAKRFAGAPHAIFVHDNFKNADAILAQAGVAYANKVLLDLGTSMFQLVADTRGFSFASDTPLRMSFSAEGSHTGFSAYDIVNEWEESSIADIIYGYGEERSARKIARAIVEARAVAPIATSGQLASIIGAAIPRRGRTNPATKTFQALRIAVNDELAVITEALNAWWEKIPSGGRISVITFHSLEDRIVKQWMKQQIHKRVTTKKPITPSTEELSINRSARSAKLRTIEKE